MRGVDGEEGALGRERTPASVARVLLDELVEVEVAVELVGLGARIAENAALVERLGHLRWRRNVSG